MTREQIRLARAACLSDYLLRAHPADVRNVGGSLCLRGNRSLYIRKGFPGYHDFANGEHGNSIDFLVRHMGYSFPDAVTALVPAPAPFRRPPAPVPASAAGRPTLPERADPPFKKVTDYLTWRGIPEDMVRYLIGEGLLYQDAPYGNAVFVSPEGDYCEIRGTGDRPFHGCRKALPDRFWYLLTGPHPTTAYVCEAAIDAVSLMLLHRARQGTAQAAYISIGGVANQKTIDRLKKRIRVVLAVDNDRAGEECRRRNPELPALLPSAKDWNEVLRRGQKDDGPQPLSAAQASGGGISNENPLEQEVAHEKEYEG